MADIIVGHVKHTPKLFEGVKCNVLKFVLIIDETLGKKVPVVVFGNKANTYSELIVAGDVLRVCGAIKENHYGDSITHELHVGDWGAGYVKKIGHAAVSLEEPECTGNSDDIPDLFFPDPTDEDYESAAGCWDEPFPRFGGIVED